MAKLKDVCKHGTPKSMGCMQCISEEIRKLGKERRNVSKNKIQCNDPACIESGYCPEVGKLKRDKK